MKTVTRLREPAIAMLILQGLLATLGFPEFMYDHPPSIVGVAASTVLAAAWITLGAWSGARGWRSFLTLTLLFWGAAITVCLLAMWAASSDAIVPGYKAILLLVIVLGPALHGMGPYVPIESQQVRYLVTAIGIFTLSLASYVIGRVARARAARGTRNRASQVRHYFAAKRSPLFGGPTRRVIAGHPQLPRPCPTDGNIRTLVDLVDWGYAHDCVQQAGATSGPR